MVRRIFTAAFGGWLVLAGSVGVPATAQEGQGAPVVVELFTSQGCSSCPPADAALAELADRPGVIALALHVDYWDYIGWKDTFAVPAFAERQRAYARAAGARTVYTPQMIVGGMDHIVGVHPDELEALIHRYSAKPKAVVLTLSRRGDTVQVRAAALLPVPHGAEVQLVRYAPRERVAIERGENAGRSVDYANIVTDWRSVGTWDGQGALALDVAAPGPAPAVVILQEPGPGQILAAAAVE